MGDPPNVILGTTLGYSFVDFVEHTGPISVIAALILLGIFYLVNRKALSRARLVLTPQKIAAIDRQHQEPLHEHLTRVGLTCFLLAVVLLVSHVPLSDLTGLPVNAAVAALIPAAIALFSLRDSQRRRVILRVDGESILFFTGLFILIGGLEKVHIFETLADVMSAATVAGPQAMVMALHWGSRAAERDCG